MDNAVSAMNSDGESQLVVFDLADEAYGVDIGSVREIIRMQEITAVPRTPDVVEGVINLRGKVIPVINLRKRFGFPLTERNKDTRIVVIDIGGSDIGATVDAVSEVLRVSTDSIEPPSAIISSEDSDSLLGIAKIQDRLILILDLQQALSVKELSFDGLAHMREMNGNAGGGISESANEEPVAAEVEKAKNPRVKKPSAKKKATA